MAVSRHLVYYRTANSAIRYADTKNRCYNKTWSGSDPQFAIYLPLNYTVTLKLGFGVTQGYRKRHYSIEHFIFVFHSNYASISYRFRDIAAYWSKIATPLYLAPPLGVTPSDLRNDPWWRKTRMMGLSGGERISMMGSAVLIQCTRVTDGRNWRGIYAQ